MKTLRKYLALAAAIAGLTQLAHAVPQLMLTDGINTVIVSDNGVGDAQGAAGQVVFVGSIGNWTLNVHSGSTYPVIGSLSNPMMDLSFNATSNGAGGTLQILFSADGFGPTSGSTLSLIGGTAAALGSVSYATYGGTNNTLFSTTNLLTSQGPFAPGAFSGTQTGGSINNAGPYSLTQIVSITHSQGTFQSTGDALLQVPESGTSILLLGAGLTGLGLVARFRRREVLAA
ncbi:MAG: hypothetical protein V4773_12960 [Verrucomicrobiota bacterium]